MISERQLAAGFHSLWSEAVPALTPHFVRIFNELYCQSVEGSAPVAQSDGAPPSLVAELAFQISKLSFLRNNLSELQPRNELVEDACAAAIAQISEFGDLEFDSPGSIDERSIAEAILLVGNYRALLAKFSADPVEFSPCVPGAGFVDACRCDLSVGEVLVEIKTVERNISGKDIRQLLTYLALQAATGQKRWTSGAFFNPRRGTFYVFPVDGMIPLISGGRTASEVFREIVEFCCNRDIQIDLAF